MVTVRLAAYYDPGLKSFVKINVILHVSHKLNCNLYAGDVLIGLNGAPTQGCPIDELTM